MRAFLDSALARMTIGTALPVGYASVSTLAADVAALQSDVTSIDGNLTSAAPTAHVTETVTEAIDDLDELTDISF